MDSEQRNFAILRLVGKMSRRFMTIEIRADFREIDVKVERLKRKAAGML